MIYQKNLVIVGSGPAGWTAAVYAARANLAPVVVCGSQPGGQLTVTTDVENYPGYADPIQGPWLMEQMEQQAKNCGAEVHIDHISRVDFSSKPFRLYSENGNEYIAKSVIIATGAQAKWLEIPSEYKFRGHGVSACAVCDGFFFRNKKVAIVGGGNTAAEEAIYLSHHASSVTLIHRRDSLKAEKILQTRLFSNPKISVIWDSEIAEIIGEESPLKFVNGVMLNNLKTNQKTKLDVSGVFIAIGHKPNTDLFVNILDMENGYIKTEPGTTNTNIQGIFAAGDVQDYKYRQAVTAAGTGCMAALDAERFLSNQ